MTLLDNQTVVPGMYKSRDGLMVEVLSQELDTNLIVLQLPAYVDPSNRLQTMSPGIFHQLFESVTLAPTGNVALVDQNFEYQSSPALTEHLVLWHQNFEWPAIDRVYKHLCDKMVHLDRQLKDHDRDTAMMYFMETLFLFYILGNRLGYPSENRFRSLHELVFSVIDSTEEGAKHTQAVYRGEEIETKYYPITLFDPRDLSREPEMYYLTVSNKDHAFPNNRTVIPRGAFLQARRK